MSRRSIALVAAAYLMVAVSPARSAERLEIALKLVGQENRPIVALPLAVGIAVGSDACRMDLGIKAITDASGGVRGSFDTTLERRLQKRTTNFFSQIVAAKEVVVRATVCVELAYAGRPWLASFDVDRFENGDIAYAQYPDVFGRDERLLYSKKASVREGAWYLPGLPGLLNVAPFRTQHAAITQTGSGWKVELTIERSSEPIQR